MKILNLMGDFNTVVSFGTTLYDVISGGSLEGFFAEDFDAEAAQEELIGRFDDIDADLDEIKSGLADIKEGLDALAADVEAGNRELSGQLDTRMLSQVNAKTYDALTRLESFDPATDNREEIKDLTSSAFASAKSFAEDILNDGSATSAGIVAAMGTLSYALGARVMAAAELEEGGHREADVRTHLENAAALIVDLRDELVKNLDVDASVMGWEITLPTVKTWSERTTEWTQIHGNWYQKFDIVEHKQWLPNIDLGMIGISMDGFDVDQELFQKAFADVEFDGLQGSGTTMMYSETYSHERGSFGWTSTEHDTPQTFTLPKTEGAATFLDTYTGTQDFRLDTETGRQMLDAYLEFEVKNLTLEKLGMGYAGEGIDAVADGWMALAETSEIQASGGNARGTDADDYIKGASPGDLEDGRFGSREVDGNDLLEGMGGSDVLVGRGGDDRLDGGAGRDMLQGGDGDDELRGGDGSDILQGGDGADVFVFDIRDGGVDQVLDFDAAEADRIAVEGTNLDADALADALTQDDDGLLWFDADGAGGAEARLLSTFTTQIDLAADILV